jgi:hypothetical protein
VADILGGKKEEKSSYEIRQERVSSLVYFFRKYFIVMEFQYYSNIASHSLKIKF